MVDEILGGGISPRQITEICGVPGVGKTQFGMQLAVNVQIPRALGGVGGHSVYLDTEGSFMLGRIVEMAKSCIKQVELQEEMLMLMPSVETIVSQISYFRILDSMQQCAIISSLPRFLEEHKEVKLIVIDSIAFHFRQDFEDMALRTRLLSNMAQKLTTVACAYNVAVVVVNQITTKANGEVVPALGESWSHACTNRVIFYWQNGERRACIQKSPSLPPLSASFCVNQHGIR